MKRYLVPSVVFFLSIVFAVPLGTAQVLHSKGTQSVPKDRAQLEMERQRLKDANRHRQQEMKRDADKLLQMATDLKLYVDRTNEDILSLDVVRKADEIEKLAKSVKEKMKTAYGPQ